MNYLLIGLLALLIGCTSNPYGPENPSPLKVAALSWVGAPASEMVDTWGNPDTLREGDVGLGINYELTWHRVHISQVAEAPKESDYQVSRTNCSGSVNAWGQVDARCSERKVTNSNYNAALAGHNLGVALARLADYDCKVIAFIDPESKQVVRVATHQSNYSNCSRVLNPSSLTRVVP